MSRELSKIQNRTFLNPFSGVEKKDLKFLSHFVCRQCCVHR